MAWIGISVDTNMSKWIVSMLIKFYPWRVDLSEGGDNVGIE